MLYYSVSMSLLKSKGLKETVPRLLVLELLSEGAHTPQALEKKLRKCGSQIGIVTVYRVLEALEHALLVHRHPLEGTYSACQLPDLPGHHVLLHCTSCNFVRETQDPDLCHRENVIAKKMGFAPQQHVSEIEGLCTSCR